MTADEEPAYDGDPVELIAAILLGLAAVAIAWSTFQSGLWGGQQDQAYTESIRYANKAVDQLQAADTIRTFDQTLFVEIVTSRPCDQGNGGDDVTCQLILANMSDEGREAITIWLGTDRSSNPFESTAYHEALYEPGEDAKDDSEQFFDEAGQANENGDDYDLAATRLTGVLFFAGISVVIKDARIRGTLLAAAGVLLIGSLGYMLLSLPIQ
jgi:hypothetical protein